jgi:hypothetical protein
MFDGVKQEQGIRICEECYWDKYHRSDEFVKVFKYCALGDIKLEDSNKICRCIPVPRFDSYGHPRKLFPVHEEDEHRGKISPLKCGLLKLNDMVAEAKYDGVFNIGEHHHSLSDLKYEQRAIARNRANAQRLGKASKQTINPGTEQSKTLKEDAHNDAPFFLQNHVNKNPFGDVRVAIRVGTLIIKIGLDR